LLLSLQAASALEPTDHWLRFYGLERWQVVFDQDADGFAAEEEFNYGTDPFEAQSHPPQFLRAADGLSFEIPITPGVSFGASQLQTSTDLRTWTPVPGFPPATAGPFALPILQEETARFYRFGNPTLGNSDGDCLLDFEELTLFGTDPLKPDTDGDGVNDCDEVTLYNTNPNYSSPTGRGAISGKVVLDEDGDPATQNHPGLAGWTVFVDLDYDSERDAFEPSAESGADGTYRIAELDPGLYRVCLLPQAAWTQVFPSLVPQPSPDGYPDRVVALFDSGKGPVPFPYGRYADPLPGLRLVFPIPPPVPVDPAIILGALPPPPIAGPFGGWWHVDVVAIPEESWLTVAFDGEEVIDGPGPDLTLVQAQAGGEKAELYLGSTEANLTSAGVITQSEVVAVDLATVNVPQPVRYVKLRALDLGGAYPGWDLVGFEALNYRPQSRGHYEITVVGGETTGNINFGVAGHDRPPKLFVSTDRTDVKAGDTLAAQVNVNDDLGVVSATLTANGAPVVLDAQFKGSVTVASGGLLELAATATDTANQESRTLFTLIARNADGSLPDLSGLGAGSGDAAGGPSIKVISPVAGEILTTARAIVGTISGTTEGVGSWQVHYAPADLVNPEALDAPDGDYVFLSEGTGPVLSASLGTLPGDTLAAGAYLVRISAADLRGTTRYLGFVIGVNIDPLDIRPAITLTAPANESTITYLTDVRGSITTRQELREWYVEHAPLSQVNLQNLADSAPTWMRIASGTSPVTDAVLAKFDPTLLPNDSYVIRVSAWNKNGLGWAEPLVVHVTGSAKLGNFAVEFIDVELPLAGIPIKVTRSYSSLNAARSGDFGYGWSLAVQEADIAETVPQTGTGFGSTPFKVGTRVYLTAPDGKRVGFTFEPAIGAVSLFGAAYAAIFKPDPGVLYTLQVPEGDTAFLTIGATGEAGLFFIPLPWNPDTYILTDKLGTSYTYDQTGGLIEIKDANGNRVTFTDDAIKHSSGPQVELTRDASGRITKITAPTGQVWAYQYDAKGDLVQVSYPGNIVATFGYSASRPHFLETINDPLRGPTQRTEYDENGRVTAVIDAAGNRIAQSWDPGSFTGTFTDARGNVTKLSYDARGNLTRREDPLGGVTTWEYKDASFPDLETAMVDPRGNRTTYKYDERGNRLEEVQPLTRTLYTYDENNRVTRKQYRSGGREEFQYDEQGNLVHYDSQLGEWTLTYTAGGQLASVLDGAGGLTRIEYGGGLGLPSRIIDANGGVKQFAYDAYGRLTRYTDPLGNATRFEYDSTGRLVKQIDPAGGEIRTTYDTTFPQQPGTVTDRAGRVTQYVYDALGRLTQVTAPGGAVTRYEYDADGNRTAVVDPVGNRWEFRYDVASRLVEEIDPLGKKRSHSYDLAGNRTETVDRNGRKRTFAFDANNRVKEERWLDPADNNNSVLRTITTTYDTVGQLETVKDPDATINPFRGAVPGGPVLSERAFYASLPERRMAFTYDRAGRRIGMSVATGTFTALSVDYTRDLAGYLRILTSRQPLPPSTVTGSNFQLQFWRNARGDVTELRRFADQEGKKQVSQTSFALSDPCGCRISKIEHVVAGNQPLPEATLSYTRDLEGTITGLQEGADLLAFSYDAAGQLTGVTRNGTATESYTYDANGNRTTSHLHASYVTGPANRLLQAGPWTLTYDDEGNLVTKSNTSTGVAFTFTWDHRNRLTRVQRDEPGPPAVSVVTEYRYDALDRRIGVVRDGQTTWTYYDGQQPIVDYLNDETAPIALHFAGERLDELHAVWHRDEGLFWTVTDHLGTVRRALDKEGVEVTALSYESYGKLISVSGTKPTAVGRFAFTAREWDVEIDIYFHRARYYDPELGRFTGEDPLGFGAGDANLYRYVGNIPVHRTDPTGKNTAPEYVVLFATLGVGVAQGFAGFSAAGAIGAACAGADLGVSLAVGAGAGITSLGVAGGSIGTGGLAGPGGAIAGAAAYVGESLSTLFGTIATCLGVQALSPPPPSPPKIVPGTPDYGPPAPPVSSP
jgi:RHS repeat-associated protein